MESQENNDNDLPNVQVKMEVAEDPSVSNPSAEAVPTALFVNGAMNDPGPSTLQQAMDAENTQEQRTLVTYSTDSILARMHPNCRPISPNSVGSLDGTFCDDDDIQLDEDKNALLHDLIPSLHDITKPDLSNAWKQTPEIEREGRQVSTTPREITEDMPPPVRRPPAKTLPLIKEYAYKKELLPKEYQGGNIRITSRHYAVGSRDELTKWDEHPWSTAAYLQEDLPVCGIDKEAPKDCTFCASMLPEEIKERKKRAKTNRKKRNAAIAKGKTWEPPGGHPPMRVANADDARRHVEAQGKIYEEDRTTYGACEKGPDGKINYRVKKIMAECSVQTMISTIYKIQLTSDGKEVRYVAELPKDLRIFHVLHPAVQRFIPQKDVDKIFNKKMHLNSVIHASMVRTDAPRVIKTRIDGTDRKPRVFFTYTPHFFEYNPNYDHETFVMTAAATGADVLPTTQSPTINIANTVPSTDLVPHLTTFAFPDDFLCDIQELFQHVYQEMLTRHYLTQITRLASKFATSLNISPYVPQDCALAPRPSHLHNCTLPVVRREFDVTDVTHDVTNGDLAILEEIARVLNLMVAKTSEFHKAQSAQLRGMVVDSKPLMNVAILNEAMAASLADVRRAVTDLLARVVMMRRREAVDVSTKPTKKQLAALLTLSIFNTDDMFPGRITVFSFILTFLIVTLAYALLINFVS